MNPIFSGLTTSVFEEMSGLAGQHGAINLGQGFPDQEGPEDLRVRAAEALMSGSNQYPPMMGLPALRQAVAAHYRRFQGLEMEADEVLVTSGATEALAAALLALISPGDEVILIQPMYDAYLPLVRRAGGQARFVRLTPPDWRLTREALEAAITPRTRLVVFNNPLNPAARVFDASETDLLAEVCVRHDLIAVCDEVWEHVLFDGRTHVPLIGRPGMGARTVKIGSAGKIFSMTGWKVGWACASKPLLSVIARAHQFVTFTTPPNLQSAVAYGLGKDEGSLKQMRDGYQRGRDRLSAGLAQAGFAVLPAQGAYFVCVDLAESGVAMDDLAFARRAVVEAGVAVIPVSAFYAEDPVTTVIRLCCAKSDATLDAGVRRLESARSL